MDPLQTTESKRFPKLLLLVVFVIIALVSLSSHSLFKGAPYSKVVPRLSEESLVKVPLLFPRQFILGQTPEVLSATLSSEEASTTNIILDFKDINNTAESLALEYEDYAPRASWSVARKNEDGGTVSLDIKRGFQEMIIRISPNIDGGGILVNINYNVKTI